MKEPWALRGVRDVSRLTGQCNLRASVIEAADSTARAQLDPPRQGGILVTSWRAQRSSQVSDRRSQFGNEASLIPDRAVCKDGRKRAASAASRTTDGSPPKRR